MAVGNSGPSAPATRPEPRRIDQWKFPLGKAGESAPRYTLLAAGMGAELPRQTKCPLRRDPSRTDFRWQYPRFRPGLCALAGYHCRSPGALHPHPPETRPRRLNRLSFIIWSPCGMASSSCGTEIFEAPGEFLPACGLS